MKTRRMTMIAMVAALIMVSAAALSQQKVFIAPVAQGLADSTVNKMIIDLVEIVRTKTGADLKSTTVAYAPGELATEITLKEMKAGRADMGYVNALEYADMTSKYPNLFEPAFILTMGGKKNEDMCMYVSAKSSAKTVADTKGMVWGGSDTLGTRFILHENGIKEPLASFYKEVKYVGTSPMTILIDSLRAGNFEVFAVPKHLLLIGGGAPGSVDKASQSSGIPYRQIYCTTYQSNWIFGYKKGFPPELSSKTTKILLGAHKDRDFARFHFMFTALKGHFVEYKKEDLARTLEIKKLKDSLGWDKERKEHNAKAKTAK
ncbi:MAG TPA: PhnD/SsuA/transferrin family substrate-binding protein [bacterium]|nr:PhnD/SsuA/transferrin family substrate-binding protein [bacterium]